MQQFLERMIRAFGSGASLPLREAVREFARFIIDIHREDPQLHNELSPEIPEDQHRTVCEMLKAYLEARRNEVRRPDLEIASYVVVEVGESPCTTPPCARPSASKTGASSTRSAT